MVSIRDFFYVPKHGKISERVVLARLAVSIGCILFYLAAMSITAYAFFSHSASTAVMTMRSACYDLTVTPPHGVVASEEQVYTLQNATAEDVTYTFRLERLSGDNRATVGFCTVEVCTDTADAPVQRFYTQPIGTYLVDEVSHTQESRRVIISVPAGRTAYVAFTAELGTCTHEAMSGERIEPVYAPTAAIGIDEDVTTTTVTTTTAATTTATTATAATSDTTVGTTATTATTTVDTTATATATVAAEQTPPTPPTTTAEETE